jgi:hypothetical protein
MSGTPQYHSATERIKAELRQEFHLRDMDQRDARLLLRMLDGRIPADKREVAEREWLRRRIERAARQEAGT